MHISVGKEEQGILPNIQKNYDEILQNEEINLPNSYNLLNVIPIKFICSIF